MALWIIIAILLVGLFLVFLEVFLIPGTSLFGILGGVAIAAGNVLMYSNYGPRYGHLTLLFSGVAVVISIAAGFKVIDSNKLAMKGKITGKVNELEKHFHVGDHGLTVTELRPNGRAIFNANKTDVFSEGNYVQKGSEVEIVKITKDKIFVKPLNS